METKSVFYGYLMTEEQAQEVQDLLTEDVLSRYNHPEYFNFDIVKEFAYDNKLQKEAE